MLAAELDGLPVQTLLAGGWLLASGWLLAGGWLLLAIRQHFQRFMQHRMGAGTEYRTPTYPTESSNRHKSVLMT
jgi:hypothetical protein